MAGFDIVEPESLSEAFDLIASDEGARPSGGNTAIMLMMKAQLYKPTRLVSLRRLGGRFRGISFDAGAGTMRVGALTTFAELEHNPEVARHFPVIAKTMVTLANVRVRNVASVGGNLAHADPHLDMPPVWLALDAELGIVGPGGERRLPVRELFAGYYETTLQPSELIADVTVPIRPDWRADYTKVTTRAAHDWPALGLAVAIRPDQGRCAEARLVLSAATDRPTRLIKAEAFLTGEALDEATFEKVAAMAAGEVDLISDDRGSADYKTHLLQVHLMRTLRGLAGA